MLAPQQCLWVFYSAMFIFLAILLLIRIRSSWLLTPFILFSLLETIDLLMKATHFNELIDTTLQRMTAYRLSLFSLLLLNGIVVSQLVFINHLAIAFSQRTLWASLRYFESAEKPLIDPSMCVLSKDDLTPSPVRPWTYWLNVALIVLYSADAIVLLIFKTLEMYPITEPICISCMAVLTVFNLLIVWTSRQFQSHRHLRVLRQNKRNLIYLLVSPLLLSISLATMAALSWATYLSPNTDTSTASNNIWLVVECVLIYLPIFIILILCFLVRKLDHLGNYLPVAQPLRPNTKNVSSKEADSQGNPLEAAALVPEPYLGTSFHTLHY
ncbi:hypothetical protein BDF14DRAFT_1937912 [Spinellus fusiger]|nr:hypothetical protein BDF14DRAFT_1937912 [Spinellus fusiger]